MSLWLPKLEIQNGKKPVSPPARMIAHSQHFRFGDTFEIRAVCHVEYTAEKHTIFSKRAVAKGNRPGVILRLNGSSVEFLTFGDGDPQWHMLNTEHQIIKAGERYEILVRRWKGKGAIYINGQPRTRMLAHRYTDKPGVEPGVSGGDLNCDEPAYVGIDVAFKKYAKFHGNIEFVGIYNTDELPTGLLPYAPHKTWLPLSLLGEMAKEHHDVHRRLII